MRGIRKKTRYSSPYGREAEYIQLSLFEYTSTAGRRPRKKRYRESTPAQKNLNDKNSSRYFKSLIEANFKEGDYHITLTFDDRHLPADEKEAKKYFTNFIRKVNDRRKKSGLDNAHWVATLERGTKSGRYHYHIIMDSALHRDIVETCWTSRDRETRKMELIGDINIDIIKRRSTDKSALDRLAAYLMKDPHGRRKWESSINLVRPWVSVSDSSRISEKSFKKLQNLPEDCEEMKDTIERIQKGFELVSIQKEYREDIGQWSFFVEMRRKPPMSESDTAT